MSTEDLVDDNIPRCANCDIKEDEGIKLKTCTSCKSVRYCGSKCQREHWPKHKKACKQRAAELRDEILFKQPEKSHLGDCPICFLPHIDLKKSCMAICCSKTICDGCDIANVRSGGPMMNKCLFCRSPKPKSQKEADRLMAKRVEANDPNAIREMGARLRREENYKEAFVYFSKAAKLGSIQAHHDLVLLYNMGLGVEKDEKKMMYHLEQAAIGGHAEARHNLGTMAWENGKKEISIRHVIIASKQGHEKAIKDLKDVYANTEGLISKADFASALRGYQAAVDATKSDQREEAEVALGAMRR